MPFNDSSRINVHIIPILGWCLWECAGAPPHAARRTRPRVGAHRGVAVGHVQQVQAALGVCEGADAQAVGRVQLLHQEAAAHLDDLRELQQARSRQQALDGLLLQLQYTWTQVTEGHRRSQKVTEGQRKPERAPWLILRVLTTTRYEYTTRGRIVLRRLMPSPEKITNKA